MNTKLLILFILCILIVQTVSAISCVNTINGIYNETICTGAGTTTWTAPATTTSVNYVIVAGGGGGGYGQVGGGGGGGGELSSTTAVTPNAVYTVTVGSGGSGGSGSQVIGGGGANSVFASFTALGGGGGGSAGSTNNFYYNGFTGGATGGGGAAASAGGSGAGGGGSSQGFAGGSGLHISSNDGGGGGGGISSVGANAVSGTGGSGGAGDGNYGGGGGGGGSSFIGGSGGSGGGSGGKPSGSNPTAGTANTGGGGGGGGSGAGAAGGSGIVVLNYQTVYPPTASFTENTTSGIVPLSVHFTDTSTQSPTSWSWTFGDGGSSSSQNPTHTYQVGGNYTVQLTATNSLGSSSASTTITVYNTVVTGFSANQTSGVFPLPIKFTTTISNDNATSWNWGFGDGSWQNGSTQNPVHTYYTGNTYSITEIASNGHSTNTTSITNYITIGNQTITGFNASPLIGFAPLSVQFNVNTPKDNATFWNWTFGDGVFTNSSLQNVSHTYVTPGIYTVTEFASNAFITNNYTLNNYINVLNAQPSSFIKNQSSGLFPLGIQFNDTTNTLSPLYWNWSLGDGSWQNKTSLPNITKLYGSGGNYTVQLFITNSSYTSYSSQFINVFNTTISGFTATPTTALAGSLVQFSVINPIDNATNWAWNFGDGNSTNISTQNVSYTPTVNGTFTIIESTSNGHASNTTTLTNYLTVWSSTVPGFTANNTHGQPPGAMAVQFIANSSNFGTQFNWSFGDGTWSNGTASTVIHSYSTTGVYDIQEIISNPKSTNSITANGLIIYMSPISFTVNATSGFFPVTILFNDTSNWLSPTDRLWNFGDGTFFNDTTLNVTSNTTHVYFQPGTYVPSLTIYNSSGNGTGIYPGYIIIYGGSSQFSQQHTTRWLIQDMWGNPIEGINVTIQPTSITYSPNWIYQMFNLNTGSVPLTGTALSGFTDDSGGVTFPTLPGITYQTTIVNDSISINLTKYDSSDQSEIVITVFPSATNPATNVSVKAFQYSFWQNKINGSYVQLGINYSDPSPYSNNITFWAQNADTMNYINVTPSYNDTIQNWSYTFPYTNGTMYYWGININSSGYSTPISDQSYIRFNLPKWLVNPLHASDTDSWASLVYEIAAIGLMVIFAAMPGERTLKQGGIVLTFMAAIVGIWWGWLPLTPVTSAVIIGAIFLSIIEYISVRGREEGI